MEKNLVKQLLTLCLLLLSMPAMAQNGKPEPFVGFNGNCEFYTLPAGGEVTIPYDSKGSLITIKYRFPRLGRMMSDFLLWSQRSYKYKKTYEFENPSRERIDVFDIAVMDLDGDSIKEIIISSKVSREDMLPENYWFYWVFYISDTEDEFRVRLLDVRTSEYPLSLNVKGNLTEIVAKWYLDDMDNFNGCYYNGAVYKYMHSACIDSDGAEGTENILAGNIGVTTFDDFQED